MFEPCSLRLQLPAASAATQPLKPTELAALACFSAQCCQSASRAALTLHHRVSQGIFVAADRNKLPLHSQQGKHACNSSSLSRRGLRQQQHPMPAPQQPLTHSPSLAPARSRRSSLGSFAKPSLKLGQDRSVSMSVPCRTRSVMRPALSHCTAPWWHRSSSALVAFTPAARLIRQQQRQGDNDSRKGGSSRKGRVCVRSV